MCRVVFLVTVITFAALVSAQTSNTNICVVSGECLGPYCNQRRIDFPERQALVRSLNSANNKTRINASYMPDLAPGCKAAIVNKCDYVVLIRPVTMRSSQTLTQSQMDAVNRDELQPATPPPPPSKGAQAAESVRRQPVDQSSLAFQLIRSSDCVTLLGSEVSRLEANALLPSDNTVDYLTSKAAEKIHKAIDKDAAQKRP